MKAKASGGFSLDVDLKLEAMEPVLNRELPVQIAAISVCQIRDAIHWANKQDLAFVIVGGRDAWRVSDLLKDNQVPVIIGIVNHTAFRRWESYDTSYKNAGLLHEAGGA